MAAPRSRTSALLFLCLSLAACAGYRGGWESLPYVGAPPTNPPETRTPFEARQRSELALPGITLGVALQNQTRTHDTQVALYGLPISVDPRTVQTYRVEPGKTRVTLRVANTAGDFVFRPQQARLVVRGEAVVPMAAYEFAMWDAMGNRVTTGGTWAHRPLGMELALSDRTRSYLLAVDFPVATPAPEEPAIALDLSQALQSPRQPQLPLIRFMPVRWREGYT